MYTGKGRATVTTLVAPADMARAMASGRPAG
jgi:hypothetical protein